MVVGAFPLIKLGGLLLRQISRPIANYMKEHAKTHPTFRTYVCMPPAQRKLGYNCQFGHNIVEIL